MEAFLGNPFVIRIQKWTRNRRSRVARPESAEDWEEKAVKALTKKLKAQKHDGDLAVRNFEHALASGDQFSPCVMIERSLDGRLQVASRKGLPHFIFCRIFRFPNLTSHNQIRSCDNCPNGYQAKKPLVCVNPYHYERTPEHGLPRVVMVPFAVPGTAPPYCLPDILANEQGRLLRAAPPENSQLPPQFMDLDTFVPTYEDNPFSSRNNRGRHASDLGSEGSSQGSGRSDSYSASSIGSPISQTSSGESLVLYGDVRPESFVEPEYWCSVKYWEEATKVGETFNAEPHVCTVDGFTDPGSPDRFCVGRLSNVHRTWRSENMRRQIGHGVRLCYLNGNVFLECLSSSSVFVQSFVGNSLYDGILDLPLGTVLKVPPGGNLQIFSNQVFADELEQAIHHGFKAVHNLTQSCNIRVSLGKGWGQDYKRRNVEETPCWIEISLNGALQWLDRVLVHMGSPTTPCHSNS